MYIADSSTKASFFAPELCQNTKYLPVDFEHRFSSRMVLISIILQPNCHWVVFRESMLGQSSSNNPYTSYLDRDCFNRHFHSPLFASQVTFISSKKNSPLSLTVHLADCLSNQSNFSYIFICVTTRQWLTRLSSWAPICSGGIYVASP